MTNTKLIELVKELEHYHHAFLSGKGARHFLKPFGLEPHLRIAKANPQDFKGLTLKDDQGNDLDEAEGMDGLNVASKIADHFKLTVPDFYGRGSQHSAYCEAIIAHLKAKEIATEAIPNRE